MAGRSALTTRALAVVVLLLVVSGCTQVHRGAAIKDPNNDSAAVNVAILDHGSYPGAALAPLGTVHGAIGGSTAEAQRMATDVALPDQVAPELTAAFPENTGVMSTPRVLGLLTSETVAAAADAHHYITGFNTERAGAVGSAPPQLLSNAVLRFPTPQDAADAAAAMSAAPDSALMRQSTPATTIPIPRYPGTLAWLYRVDGAYVITAYTAHGPYVLYQYAGSKVSADQAADLVANTVDVQAPLIDAFIATPVDQLASLPLDPTGLLARTVPAKQYSDSQATVYSPHGALHFEPNLDAAQKMYSDLGIDAVAVFRTWVYQTKDADAAHAGLDRLLAATVANPQSYTPVAGIPGMPQARCYTRAGGDPDSKYLCMATADRYLFKATAAQDIDARQAVASQYLMLTTPR